MKCKIKSKILNLIFETDADKIYRVSVPLKTVQEKQLIKKKD
jgi:hypothetical protein